MQPAQTMHETKQSTQLGIGVREMAAEHNPPNLAAVHDQRAQSAA
jgi:hypothetical protein